MTVHIQSTNQYKAQDYTPASAWFIYGDTGAGKTRAAATFPSPLFLIPANENSFVTLLDDEEEFPFIVIGKDPVTGKTLRANEHLHQVLTYIENRYYEALRLQAAGKEQEAYEAFPYQTIVVESLTHMTDLVLEAVTDHGRKKTTHATWGAIATFLRTLHDRLRALDVHIVYTALAQTKGDSDKDIVRGMPAITGSMAEKMPSACDVLAYCEVIQTAKGPTYRMHFSKCGPFQARTRFTRMPKFVDNFRFGDVELLMRPLVGATNANQDQE